jgi:hypothetical protein
MGVQDHVVPERFLSIRDSVSSGLAPFNLSKPGHGPSNVASAASLSSSGAPSPHWGQAADGHRFTVGAISLHTAEVLANGTTRTACPFLQCTVDSTTVRIFVAERDA